MSEEVFKVDKIDNGYLYKSNSVTYYFKDEFKLAEYIYLHLTGSRVKDIEHNDERLVL